MGEMVYLWNVISLFSVTKTPLNSSKASLETTQKGDTICLWLPQIRKEITFLSQDRAYKPLVDFDKNVNYYLFVYFHLANESSVCFCVCVYVVWIIT